MPTPATTTKPRKRGAKRASAEPTLTPEEIQAVQESIERLRSLDLPEEDGEPLESDYHVMQIPLLDELVRLHRGDTFVCKRSHFSLRFPNCRKISPCVIIGAGT